MGYSKMFGEGFRLLRASVLELEFLTIFIKLSRAITHRRWFQISIGMCDCLYWFDNLPDAIYRMCLSVILSEIQQFRGFRTKGNNSVIVHNFYC